MICHECKKRPAALYFTKVVNGEKTEVNLCEKCAQDKGDMFMFSSNSGFSINNLLSGLLNIDGGFKDPTKDTFQRREIVQCEQCSMTLNRFIKIGRFGCVNCYNVFKDQLKPILRRLHSGNWTHNGKIPARIGGDLHIKKEIESLKEQLQQLILQEEFENAAIVRDQIRDLENELVNGVEGGE